MGFRWNQLTKVLFAGACSVVLTTGCGHPIQRKLEGRWVGQAVENFDDRDIAVATGWAKGTSFEFAGPNLTVTVPAEDPRSAPYKVAKVHKSDVTLSVMQKDGQKDVLRLMLDDEHSLRWMLSDNRSILMRRE